MILFVYLLYTNKVSTLLNLIKVNHRHELSLHFYTASKFTSAGFLSLPMCQRQTCRQQVFHLPSDTGQEFLFERNRHFRLVLLVSRAKINFRGPSLAIREFKKTTTPTATGTSLNKRFNEQDNTFWIYVKILGTFVWRSMQNNTK